MAGFAEGLAADPRLGQLLGEYRIKELLGRGGMGVVYLAEHERLGRNVALKLLAPALVQNDVIRERFVRESRRAAAIDHPNIIPVFEAGEADGHLFIAMRYVAGVNLHELLTADGGCVEPDRAVRLVAQVGSALDAAHAVGLVHRDVKPANVMVDEQAAADGEHCYLTDFGLTKDISSSTGFTDTGQFVGTIQYVAPEQVEGRPLDARTDIYALGCVLYQCLTGEVPYPRDNDLAVMFAHVSEPPPRPCAARPELDSAMNDVIARAMAKSQSDRHRTCAELVAEARDALAGKRSALPPPSSRRFVRRASGTHPPQTPPPSVSSPPAAPPPSRQATSAEPARPPIAAPSWPGTPPPGWPAASQQHPAPGGGPNYVLAAAIVAIAVLLTTGGVVAALVLSKDDGGSTSRPSADESAAARRLIQETAELNRDVIRLEAQIADSRANEQRLVERLAQERAEARRLRALAAQDLSKLRRVESSLIASNKLVERATKKLDKYIETKDSDILGDTTIVLQGAAGHANDAAEAYPTDAGVEAEVLPEDVEVSMASLPSLELDVPEAANVKIVAGVEGSVSHVTGAGDVNGDGRGDLVVGWDSEGLSGATVVFGQAKQTEIDLFDLGSGGFEITGASSSIRGSVEAGDVDGDGNDDVILPSADDAVGNRHFFVVYGSDEATAVDLADSTDRATGLKLAVPSSDRFVESAADERARGVGDVNGDGRDDVAFFTPARDSGPGAVFVATNLARGEEVAMDTLGDDGFEVTGEGADDAFGGELARAGDVNGDDLDDFVVGAPHAREDSGAAYVIFGVSEPKDVDVGELGDRGITLTGGNGTTAGASLAGLGDVNGDGSADIAVGAPTAAPDGRDKAGVAYVVFGRGAGDVELQALGAGGFRIDGPTAGTSQTELFSPGLAGQLAPIGDVNGDRTPDLAISASEIDDGTDLAYVVYGKSSPTRVDLSKPGGEAARLNGASGASMTFGSGVDYDGDKVFELPFSLRDEGLSASNGYLLNVKR